MKGFFKYLISLFALILLFTFILEFIYTKSFNDFAIKTKVQWIRSMEATDSLDYAIFGSSRALNHLIPSQIKTETGKVGINLAYNASSPFEIELTVREFLKRVHVPRIFIQVDHMFFKENPDGIGKISWIPFIKEKEIYESFKPYGQEYQFYHFIPFIRYQKFDSRLGYRYVLSNYLKKGNFVELDYGFVRRNGEIPKNASFSVPHSLEGVSNRHFQKIEELCREKDVDVYFFTAPYYRLKGSLEQLKTELNQYHDFSNAIENSELFSNATHLNGKGAKEFTDLFIETYFNNPITLPGK